LTLDTLTPTAEPTPEPHGPFAALRKAVPSGEVIRFLLVGGFNTVFAYVLYVAFVFLFGHLFPHLRKEIVADLALTSSLPIAITVAFLGYKHFVFRTHGNYLKEWLRCFAVYGASWPVQLVILPLATAAFSLAAITRHYAPQLAGLVNSACIASYSYFAHKKFSFKQ
jgi:putative flippase GtrA